MSQFAVNGKTPIAVWCPSRDDAGNGTTTLNDLVGSNHGTLTNMDAATDWVADTGAGGIRALDFDGANDQVRAGSTGLPTGDFTVSLWFWHTATGSDQCLFTTRNILTSGSRNGIAIYLRDAGLGNVSSEFVRSGARVTAIRNFNSASAGWVHVVARRSGGTITTTVSGIGDATATGSSLAITHEVGATLGLWRDYSVGAFPVRIDDLRIFDAALDASDVSYLWHSGNGRGRLANTQSRRRRNARGGYGL